MKRCVMLLCMVALTLAAIPLYAQNTKVVVIPLNSNRNLEYTEEFEAQSYWGVPTYVELMSDSKNGICFLVKVSMYALIGINHDICEVYIDDGSWMLKAYAGELTQTTVCKARCLKWQD